MTTKQQKLAQAIREGKITDKTTASVFVMVEELNDRLDEEIPQIKNILKKVKGDVGEKGSKGDRGEQGIQGIQGIQGNPGTKGDKGLKGDTPTIDTAKIALEASNMAIEAIKPSIPDIKDISDELPQLGTQIRDSLELLIGKEKLDKSAIYGLENYDEISQLAKQPKGIFGGGGSPAGALRMDGSNSPMADISWGSYKITNLATPTSDYDASTKKYVDDSVSVENLWDRSGTTLSPNNVGDNVLLTGTLGAGATTVTSLLIPSTSGLTTPNTSFQLAGTTTAHNMQIDTGINFDIVDYPARPTIAIVALNGNINAGKHYYYLTYVTARGETEVVASNPTNITTSAGNLQVDITVVASTDYRVTGINIYRTGAADGDNYYNNVKLVNSVPLSNTNQVYRDNVADASRTGLNQYYRENTTNAQIYINSQDTTARGMLLGVKSTYLGIGAGGYITSGGSNSFFGRSAGAGVTTGNNNVLVGFNAGYSGNSNNNSGLGYNVLSNNTGGQNAAVGYNALYQSGVGASSIAMGYSAGSSINAGIDNTILGGYAASGGSARSLSNSIFLGHRAGRYETAVSTLLIDSFDRTTEAASRTGAIIYGLMSSTAANQDLIFNAQVGINITPTAYFTLPAGTATAGTAPLKFSSGVSLTTAEAGAMEFTTDDFFATITTGVARKAFVLDDGTRLTSTKVPVAFTNGRLIDSSLYSDGADNWWVGDGTGLPYGSCYGHMIGWTQATAVQNTWYNISDTDMTDGELNLIAHDGSGKLTVTKAGRYLINYSVCFNSSENSTHIESGIEISGSGSANAAGIMCFDTHERLSVTSGTAVIDLAASATIEVCVRTTSAGTPTLTCESLNISAIMVGGT
jgi:hypothetical protein